MDANLYRMSKELIVLINYQLLPEGQTLGPSGNFLLQPAHQGSMHERSSYQKLNP